MELSIRVRALACAAVGTLVGSALGVDFYGVEWSGTPGAPATSGLYRFSSTGSGETLIGDTGLTRLNSLAYTAAGSLATFSSTNGSGYILDPLTGAATFLFDQSGMVSDDVRALAINGSGWYVINDDIPDALYRIDPSTGIATLVGSTGRTGLQSLTFSSSGVLYAVDVSSSGPSKLGTIDLGTGAFTEIGGDATSCDPQTLAFDSAGTLYGVETGELWTINMTTGAMTLAGATTFKDIRGAEVVPEPATLAALGLGALTLVRRRSRPRTTRRD